MGIINRGGAVAHHNLGLYFAVCGLPVPGVAWVFLVPPALGFLLGAANLALILTGHPPRENRALWEALACCPCWLPWRSWALSF